MTPVNASYALSWEEFLDIYKTSARRGKTEQELRSFYDSYFAGERTFAFDQQGWTLETGAGIEKTSWAGLQGAQEAQHTFALWAENQIVLVPKRALTEPEIDLLRQLALAAGAIKASFHVGFLDYTLTEIPSFWRRNSPRSAFYLAALMILFAIVHAFVGQGPALLGGIVVGAMLLGALILIVQSLYFSVKYVFDRKSFAVSWEGDFSDRGATAKTSTANTFLAWTYFKKFKETRRCYLLYSDAGRYYFIVKKCLSADQQTALCRLFKAKLAEE